MDVLCGLQTLSLSWKLCSLFQYLKIRTHDEIRDGIYEKSQRGNKCICSICFRSAKLGGLLHCNRFLMFSVSWLMKIFQKEAPLPFGPLLRKYKSCRWNDFFQEVGWTFQFVWKTSKHLWMDSPLYRLRSGARFYKNWQVILKSLFRSCIGGTWILRETYYLSMYFGISLLTSLFRI